MGNKNSHSTAQIVVMFFNFITGLCLVTVAYVLTLISNTTELSVQLRYLFRIFPAFCFGDGLVQLAMCTNDGQDCPSIGDNGYDFTAEPVGPFDADITGLDLIFLAVEGALYFLIVLAVEILMRYPKLWQRWTGSAEDSESASIRDCAVDEDVDVREERQLVKHVLEQADELKAVEYSANTTTTSAAAAAAATAAAEAINEQFVVCLENLRKVYSMRPAVSRAVADLVDIGAAAAVCLSSKLRAIPCLSARSSGYAALEVSGEGDGAERQQSREECESNAHLKVESSDAVKVAVQSLSFGIRAGECFGFLGINGAGKTSTLSILSGGSQPSAGRAFIAGFNTSTHQNEVRTRIGFCGQFDALFELLSVREHLQLYGRIKGFRGASLEANVRRKIVRGL